MYTVLETPCCARAAQPAPGGLVCPQCARTYRVVDGVPVFSDESWRYTKEHFASDEAFEQFVADVRTCGWETALTRARTGMHKPHTFDALAFDLDTRDLSAFLGTRANEVILDYGCGMGGISFSLARRAKTVYALDQCLLRTRFNSIRATACGVNNVAPVCIGTSDRLPFREAFFDTIIMNGVLEWMPLAKTGRPRDIQRAALCECRRVLKPGGKLYLAIENRFGYRYLFEGRGDSHNQKKRKLPFITILPRWLAQVYSWLTVQGPYRCYLYSARGYETLLHEAGFRTVSVFFPYPKHNTPTYLIPLDRPQETKLFIQQILNVKPLSRFERMMLALMAYTKSARVLSQEYALIAER